MAFTEFSITRALNELKLLDSRINNSIREAKFVSIQVGKALIDGQVDIKVFAERAAKILQTINALISRRDEVKSKIVASNAVTKVTIGKNEMTVAEAIDRKTSIVYKKSLLNVMRTQYVQSTNKSIQENAQVKARLDKNIETMLGKDAAKDKPADVATFTATFNELNEAKIIDPLEIKGLIDDLQAEIENFENEVDFILSESNVKTTIILAD